MATIYPSEALTQRGILQKADKESLIKLLIKFQAVGQKCYYKETPAQVL